MPSLSTNVTIKVIKTCQINSYDLRWGLRDPAGVIVLLAGEEHICPILDDHLVEFLNSMDEIVFKTKDLQPLVYSGKIELS